MLSLRTKLIKYILDKTLYVNYTGIQEFLCTPHPEKYDLDTVRHNLASTIYGYHYYMTYLWHPNIQTYNEKGFLDT